MTRRVSAARLQPAERSEVAALVIEVRSLEAAACFLRQHGLLARQAADRVTISEERLRGVRIELVAGGQPLSPRR